MNTTYFHSLVKRNNKRREIIDMERRNRETTIAFTKVVEGFIDHFQNLLGTWADCTST